jgi:hypothetical protein
VGKKRLKVEVLLAAAASPVPPPIKDLLPEPYLQDNLGIHTPKGSLLLRALLNELRGKLVLVFTPPYDPESNCIEWLWRSLRRAVTHTHTHATLPPLLQIADKWAHKLTPWQILRQIGSPLADTLHPPDRRALAHAA